jgi:hypothetical protein
MSVVGTRCALRAQQSKPAPKILVVEIPKFTVHVFNSFGQLQEELKLK